jgi:hypothetical protein
MKTIALLIALLFSSCAEYPVALAVRGNYGTYSYNPDRGVVIEVDATK